MLSVEPQETIPSHHPMSKSPEQVKAMIENTQVHKIDIKNDLVDILFTIYKIHQSVCPDFETPIKYEIEEYISNSLKMCNSWTVLTGLYYLKIYSDMDPLSLENLESHFWISIILSQKMHEDLYWDNKDYDRILNFKTVTCRELSQREWVILESLDYNLVVTMDKLEKFVLELQAIHEGKEELQYRTKKHTKI
jgi:hypothetical protein